MSERDTQTPRVVDPEAGVVEGDDAIPRQPAPPLDPYTPDPGPGPGERRAFNVLRLAWIVIAVLVALIVWVLTR
jgi:hypothetical protein